MSDSNGCAGRELLLAKCSRQYHETDPIPGLGRVRLRTLTAAERLACEARKLDPETGRICLERLAEYWAYVMIQTIVDEDGDQILCESDVPSLCHMDAMRHDMLTDEIQRLCLTPITEAAIEDVKKNSLATQSEPLLTT